MKQSFFKGTVILVISGLITRGLGTIYRIFLSRVIGAEAIGLYQMAFPTMILFITIVSSGIPVAVSKLVAEANAKKDIIAEKKILRISLMIVSIISIFLSIIFYFLIPIISKYLLTDIRVYQTLVVIVPIIPIISISSVMRGYFQGKHNMIPTATSTIIETIFRIISGIFFSLLLLPKGIEYASAGAMIGMVIGEIAGFITLIITYIRNKENKRNVKMTSSTTNKVVYNNISKLAVPITTSQLFASLSYFIEPAIVAHSLALAGIATNVATSLYGQLSGMALLIINFPTVITYSMSQSLLPVISEAAAKRDFKAVHARLNQAIDISLIIGIGAAMYLFIMADYLATLLFDIQEVGHLIKIMAPFGIFLYIQKPLAATLQGLDHAKETMNNSIIASVIKTVAIFVLASQLRFGIDGVAIAINIGMLLVTLLHLRSVVNIINFRISIIPIIKICLSAFSIGYLSYYIMENILITLPLILKFILVSLIFVIIYISLLFFTKVINKKDFKRIPRIGSKP